jgi:outer membrane lipoprotein-sorting protein
MQTTKLYLRRISIFWFLFTIFLSQNALARKNAAPKNAAPKNAASKDAAQKDAAQKDTAPKSATASLESVLTSMDKAADSFKTTEADFVWDQFTKVVEQTETQKGKIYFRKVGNEVQMMADVTGPEEKDHKSVLFTDSKIQVYEPQLDQVTIHKLDKSFETYLMLGFGSRGHDLAMSFDVTYLGSEKLDGVETGKINLVPKSAKVKNTFDHIILWIDPSRGISVQQKLITPNEDYRLAKYSDIRFPQKLADNVFKLKTSGKTKFVTP